MMSFFHQAVDSALGARGRERQHRAGFTLVEMMIVVAMLIVVSVAAARYYSRGRRGEESAAFARVAGAVFEQARQISLVPGMTARLRLATGDAYSLILEKREAGPAPTWRPVSRLVAPKDLLFCNPVVSADPAAVATASCPLSSEQHLYFTGGQVRYTDAGGAAICPTGTAVLCQGISFPIKTIDNGKRWSFHLFGLTGMARVADQW